MRENYCLVIYGGVLMNDVDLKVKEYLDRGASCLRTRNFAEDCDSFEKSYLVFEIAKMIQLQELNTTKKRSKSTSKKQFSDEAKEVMAFLIKHTGVKFKADSETHLGFIEARLKEGYPVSDLLKIIRVCTENANNEDHYFKKEWLSPETMFNKTKCAKYRGWI